MVETICGPGDRSDFTALRRPVQPLHTGVEKQVDSMTGVISRCPLPLYGVEEEVSNLRSMY